MTIGSEGLLIVPPLLGDMMLAGWVVLREVSTLVVLEVLREVVRDVSMLVGWEVLREVQAVAVVGEVVLEGFHSPVVEAKLA